MNSYLLLKVVHTAAVITWLGGAAALAFVTAILVRARNQRAIAAHLASAGQFGRAIMGPASILVLISGFAMVVLSGMDFSPLWLRMGLAAILLHFLFGAVVIRRATARLHDSATSAEHDVGRMAAQGRRLGALNVAYLLLMFIAVAAMVFKPV